MANDSDFTAAMRRIQLREFIRILTSVIAGAVVAILLVRCVPVSAEIIPQAANAHRATLVRAAHSTWGLDAPIATFAAQVHQESRWRADAESPVGALGIAQFMPATAVWMEEIYPRTLANADPLNPGWALRAMVKYDLWLHQRNHANDPCDHWAMTLAAYNGGQGWVNRERKLALASGADGL